MRTKPSRGSHLPVLMKLVELTKGPILELGSGMYSTCYLHWACFPTKRWLVTYEDNKDWIKFATQFENDYHKVHVVTDWDSLDFSGDYSIALVDHDARGRRRARDVEKLTHVDYVVCHDTENISDRKYGWSSIFKLFKYRWKYTGAGIPYTTVFSNKYELRGL